MSNGQGKASAIEDAKRAALMALPIVGPITLMAEGLAEVANKLVNQGDIQELKKQEVTQKVTLRMALLVGLSGLVCGRRFHGSQNSTQAIDIRRF